MKNLKIFGLITLLVLFTACGGGDSSDDNITVKEYQGNNPLSSTESDSEDSDENNLSSMPLDDTVILDNDHSIIGYHPQLLNLKPLVDMKVGVDHDWCNRVVPTGSVKYVSTTGDDDSADGTLSNPYKTVSKAVLDAEEGDTIMIRGGTYVETDEIKVKVPNLTITSYHDEWAVIDRSSSTYKESKDSGIYLDVDSDGSTVQCLEIKGGLYALSTETKWNSFKVDKMGATNITVRNIKAHDSYADVIKIKPNSDDFNISYSEIYNSGIGQNHKKCNAEGIDNVNADRTTASHLYIHNICSNGVYFKGGSMNSVLEYSFLENIGEGGVMLGFDTSPDYFDMTTNPNMYECLGCSAHHNLIKYTKGAGIGLYGSRSNQVYNNTIVNTSSSFQAPLYFGVTFQDGDEDGKRPANVYMSVYNNIIEQTMVTDKPLISISYSDELGGLYGLSGILTIDNNCYHQKRDMGFVALGATFEDKRNGGWMGDFIEWKKHISRDKKSEEIDPQLDIYSVSHTFECKFMGYTIGHVPTDDLIFED